MITHIIYYKAVISNNKKKFSSDLNSISDKNIQEYRNITRRYVRDVNKIS